MKTGEKLKRIRKFRGYNQPEFAIMVGMGENAAPRIAQYESGYRVVGGRTSRHVPCVSNAAN